MSTIQSYKPMSAGPSRPRMLPAGHREFRQQDGVFLGQDSDTWKWSWKPNLAGAEQSVASAVLAEITTDEKALRPSQLSSLPSGSWVVIQRVSYGLNEFRLLHFGSASEQAKMVTDNIATMDRKAFQAKLTSPDGEHFSGTTGRDAAYPSESFVFTDRGYRVDEEQAKTLLELANCAPPTVNGHIGGLRV